MNTLSHRRGTEAAPARPEAGFHGGGRETGLSGRHSRSQEYGPANFLGHSDGSGRGKEVSFRHPRGREWLPESSFHHSRCRGWNQKTSSRRPHRREGENGCRLRHSGGRECEKGNPGSHPHAWKWPPGTGLFPCLSGGVTTAAGMIGKPGNQEGWEAFHRFMASKFNPPPFRLSLVVFCHATG